MRLKTKYSQSRQTLAAELRMDQHATEGFFSWERRRLLIHATKTALAASFCWWLARHFGLHDGYWSAISAIIVLQSNFGSTITASRDRLLGTLLGAVIGFSFSFVDILPWNFFLAILAAIVICGLLNMRNSSRLAGVTIAIVMLVPNTSSRWQLALDRVIEVLLGIVVALAVSTLIFPDRARVRLQEGLAQEFLKLGIFFETILQGFRGSPCENHSQARADALAMLRDNMLLLQAYRKEPAGGAGWREGLGLLTQLGRALFDAMVALEIAVTNSHNDLYVQQLEPELGQLATDIHDGFIHVANCIHNWRFDVVPKDIHIETDIAQLAERMRSVRHTAAEFSQDEILRSYAVLLHLKQIAKQIRAARVETSRTLGEPQP